MAQTGGCRTPHPPPPRPPPAGPPPPPRGPGRTERPTPVNTNRAGTAALITFVVMVTLLGVALVQRHTPDGNPDAAFAGAVIAFVLATAFALVHDRRAKGTR